MNLVYCLLPLILNIAIGFLANIVQKHKIKYGKYTPDLSVFKTLYKIESETVSILAKLCEEVKNERS